MEKRTAFSKFGPTLRLAFIPLAAFGAFTVALVRAAANAITYDEAFTYII